MKKAATVVVTARTSRPVRSTKTKLEIDGAKTEPRLARAIRKAIRKVAAKVSIYDLSVAIGSKDVKRALKLIQRAVLIDALTPCARIIEDTVIKGGRIAAETVNDRNG
jgi:hypothetical protein